MSCSISFLNALLYCTSLTSGCLKTTTSYWLKPAINCWNFGQFSRDRQRFYPFMGRPIVPNSMHQLTCVEPTCQISSMRSLSTAIVNSNNHWVPPTGRTQQHCGKDSPINSQCYCANRVIFFPATHGWRKEKHIFYGLPKVLKKHMYLGCLFVNHNKATHIGYRHTQQSERNNCSKLWRCLIPNGLL